MLNADNDILTFVAHQAVVAAAGAFVYGLGQIGAVGLQSGKFFEQVLLALSQGIDLLLGQGAGLARAVGGGGDFLCHSFGLLHQLYLAILNLENLVFAGINFVGESAVFLVFAGLELLVG